MIKANITNRIALLVATGVDSLKIEGRMKSPEYSMNVLYDE